MYYSYPQDRINTQVIYRFALAHSLVQDCVLTRSSEFRLGVRRKDMAKPWFRVWVWSSEKGSGLSLVWQVRSSGKETGRTLVWQVRSFEKGTGRTLVWQFLSSEKKTWLNHGSAGSEFGERNSGRFGVGRKNRAEPWFGRF